MLLSQLGSPVHSELRLNMGRLCVNVWDFFLNGVPKLSQVEVRYTFWRLITSRKKRTCSFLNQKSDSWLGDSDQVIMDV